MATKVLIPKGFDVNVTLTMPAAPGTTAVKQLIKVANDVGTFEDANRIAKAVQATLQGVQLATPPQKGWSPMSFGTDVQPDFMVVDVPDQP